MTVYLNRTFFKPALIVLSALGGVLFLLFTVLTIAFFHVALLVITLLIAAAYGVLTYLAYRVSKSDKCFMQEENEGLYVRYPSINSDKGAIRIPFKALIAFDFYPIESKEGWLNFIAYGVVPDCVYITYINRHGRQVTELFGYITQSDAEALAARYGMEFILHK